VVGVCGLAVLCADLVLFGAARRLGPRVWSWRWLRGLVSEPRRSWVATQVARYGGAAIFVARFLPGVRVVVFLVAGLHGMRTRRFVAFDVLGLCISVPLLVLVGRTVSARASEVVMHIHHIQFWALVLTGAAVLMVLLGSFTHARS
jgi:membrane protein DedA with SNARE-associated domain